MVMRACVPLVDAKLNQPSSVKLALCKLAESGMATYWLVPLNESAFAVLWSLLMFDGFLANEGEVSMADAPARVSAVG